MSKKSSFKTSKIAYSLTLGLLNSLRILTWLPPDWQAKLGKKLGRLLMKISPRMLNVAKKNISLCFPQLEPHEQQLLLEENFENLGRGVFESLNAAWGSSDYLTQLIGSVEGAELIETARQQNASVVLLFPHMIPMYLIGRLLFLQLKIPMALMYNAPKNKAVNDFIYQRLAPHTDAVFCRKDLRSMLKYLKQKNKYVWYAPDLDISRQQIEFVPFFGQPAATLIAPLKIAKLTQAKFFPLGFYRSSNGKYQIKIYPELTNFPSDDPLADLTQINQIMEEIILQQPSQYLWQYKRFSTRPDKMEKIY